MEIHFLTPTPMEASLRFSTQTPVSPSRMVASTPKSWQVVTRADSIALMKVWRSLPRFLRSTIG